MRDLYLQSRESAYTRPLLSTQLSTGQVQTDRGLTSLSTDRSQSEETRIRVAKQHEEEGASGDPIASSYRHLSGLSSFKLSALQSSHLSPHFE